MTCRASRQTKLILQDTVYPQRPHTARTCDTSYRERARRRSLQRHLPSITIYAYPTRPDPACGSTTSHRATRWDLGGIGTSRRPAWRALSCWAPLQRGSAPLAEVAAGLLRVLDLPAAPAPQRPLLVHGHEKVGDAFQVRVLGYGMLGSGCMLGLGLGHILRLGYMLFGRRLGDAFHVGARPGARRAAVRAGAHERVVHQAAATEVHKARGEAACGASRRGARVAAAGCAALLGWERRRVLLRLAERDALALAHHLIEAWRLVRVHHRCLNGACA